MNFWTAPVSLGDVVLDLSVLCALLLAATLLRRYGTFFQQVLIPTILIAGALGLALGPEVLHLLPFSTERMGFYVYHLLALTFIGVGLQGAGGRPSRGALHLGFIQVLSMLLQALLGLVLALGIYYFLDRAHHPAAGMLLPLGFAMGPGIALSIGQSWAAYGFTEAASVGLMLAALGYAAAYFTGIPLVNRGIRNGLTTQVKRTDLLSAEVRTGIIRDAPPVGARLTLSTAAIEPLTFHLALIGAVYLLTWGLCTALALGLERLGAAKEIPTLWSFHFIVGNLLAQAVRHVLHARKAGAVLDPGMLHRGVGLLVDLMIAASVMAISLTVAWNYMASILVMSILCTLMTLFSIRWVCERVFEDHHFERFAGIYGEMTGTLSSGLALVRVTDPTFSTPVAQDLALSSGIALALGFPLLLAINLPFTRYNGALEGYFVVLGILLVYLAFLLLLWRRFGLTRRLNRALPL
jgi:ESS family glutamate:Na+ symporter